MILLLFNKMQLIIFTDFYIWLFIIHISKGHILSKAALIKKAKDVLKESFEQ